MDCLLFWVRECHVDGFCFALGTVKPGFDRDAPLFQAMLANDALGRCKLIAEPWDMGSGAYQVGAFPGRFAEWNDHFRDDIRSFWLHGQLSLGQFARLFAADSDVFNQCGRAPHTSINMVAAHDRFTLQDVVSFNRKYNQPNSGGNRDGSDHNFNYNHGVEGLIATMRLCNTAGPASRYLLTRCLWPREHRCCWLAMNMATASKATAIHILRITKPPGSTGPKRVILSPPTPPR